MGSPWFKGATFHKADQWKNFKFMNFLLFNHFILKHFNHSTQPRLIHHAWATTLSYNKKKLIQLIILLMYIYLKLSIDVLVEFAYTPFILYIINHSDHMCVCVSTIFYFIIYTRSNLMKINIYKTHLLICFSYLLLYNI